MKLTRKKIILLIVLLIFFVVVSVFYFFAVYRMEATLESVVSSQSKGKLHFEVDKIRLNFFDLTFEIKECELFTVDSINAENGYRVKAKRISVDMNSLKSMISKKHLLIDSLIIQSPVIELTKYKDIQKEKVSLPEEIDKVYKSLESALKVLNLDYLRIADVKFTIDDRSNPATKPLTVSNINFTVSNFSEREVAGKDRFLFADRILLEVFNQDILLPDKLHGIKFKRLRLSTRSKTIKLDSCYVYGLPPDTLSGEFNIFLDSLRISNLDFNQLVKNNAVKVDSAICYQPDVYFRLFLKNSNQKVDLMDAGQPDAKQVEQNLKKMLGNLDIGYLGIKTANIKVAAKKEGKEKIFQTQNSNFSMGKLFVSTEENVPISIKQFDLHIRNYVTYSPDSLYEVSFEGIKVMDKKIQLINFNIKPTPKNKDRNKKTVKMEIFEIDDINWPVLFFEHRILAGHASLIKPGLNINLPKPGKKQPGETQENPFVILSKLHEKIRIDNLFIENGDVNIKIQNGHALSLANCYAGLEVNKLLESDNAVRLIDAIDTFSFSRGSLKNQSIQLVLSKVRYSQLLNSLYFGQIKENKTDKSSVTSINNARIYGINIQSFNDIELSRLSWEQAELYLNLPKKSERPDTIKRTNNELKFTLKKLNGGSTIIRLQGEAMEVSTNVKQISTDEIIIKPDQKLVINNLNIEGNSISLIEDRIDGSITLFNIRHQKESSIENVKINLPVNGERLSLFVPRLIFSSDINQSVAGKLTASYIELRQPEISFSPLKNNSAVNQKKVESKIPQLDIGSLIIDEPHFKNFPATLTEKMNVDPGILNISVKGILSGNDLVKVDSVQVSSLKSGFSNNKIKMENTGNEFITISGSDFLFIPAKSEAKPAWSGTINSFKSGGIKLKIFKNDTVKQNISVNSFNFNNLNLSSGTIKDYSRLFQNNPLFTISDGNLILENEKIHFEAHNLSFNKSAKSLTIDSLAFFPMIDRDSFMSTKKFQSNYMQLYSGLLTVNNINLEKAATDSVVDIQKITANNLFFKTYKDKRLPFEHNVTKPFLTEMLNKVKFKYSADSVIFRNSAIEYEEFNDKTQQYGKINISKIRGRATNLKNYNHTQTDSLKLNVQARFMDATNLRLLFEQSYTDSLFGFQLKVIGSSFDLRKLNPLLEPIVSAEVKTGYLDTLRMSVIGRKYVAFGEMKMHYHGLNVQYLDKGSEVHQSLKAKTISFFANRIVHKNNRWGTGKVYAERDPEKGFVNYWVKILVGGVLTNTGVRTEKKQIKKYEKGLKMHDVPPIPNNPVDF